LGGGVEDESIMLLMFY